MFIYTICLYYIFITREVTNIKFLRKVNNTFLKLANVLLLSTWAPTSVVKP